MSQLAEAIHGALKPIALRDYQMDAVDALWEYFRTYTGNPLIAMPTGTGKSLVVAAIIKRMLWEYPGATVMALTHVKKLIDQNHKKLLQLWPTAPCGIFSAGLERKDVGLPILFAGIQSLAKPKTLELFRDFVPDVLLIDEAHLVSPDAETQYRSVIAFFKAIKPAMKVVGLSATCYRLGLGMLTEGPIFTHICCDMTTPESFVWFVANGYLAPLHAKRTREVLDTTGVQMSGSDYNQKQLQAAVDKKEITLRALTEACQWGHDRNRWMIFASGVNHADHIAEMINAMGVSCVTVHSGNDDDTNDKNLRAFELGQVRAAVSMNSLTTGVDVPEVDFIVILRPTKSTNLWVQMLGRGTRPAPWAGKVNCLVADFTNNSRDLGPINNPNIPAKPGKRKKKGDVPAQVVKVCPQCAGYNAVSARWCEQCGAEFHFAVRIQEEVAAIEVMTYDQPLMERFEVSHVTHIPYQKKDKPKAMLATYYVNGGLRRIKEPVCFEHGDAAARRARTWWIEHMVKDGSVPAIVPDNTNAALALAKTHLREPKWIKVWVNAQPYEKIIAYEF